MFRFWACFVIRREMLVLVSGQHDWVAKPYYAWEAHPPHRGIRRDMPPYPGWSQQLVFYAFESQHPGTKAYYAWEADGPHRGIVRDTPPYPGWSQQLVFYAFESQQPGTKAYYAWEADGPHRGIVRDTPPYSGWTQKLIFYAYDAPPGAVTLCSDISEVKGDWASLGTVVGEMVRTVNYGTKRTDTSSTTEQFTSAVTAGIATSANVFFASATVSAEFRHEWSKGYSTEIQKDYSKDESFTITVGSERQGRQLWQFKFTSKDHCAAAGSTTWTKSYAFTSSKVEQPCCYPGYCTDAAIGSCNWCTPGYTLPAMKDLRCKEGNPPCEAGTTVQLSNVNAFVTLDHEVQSGNQHTMDCPAGFSGRVVIACHIGKATIQGEQCVEAPRQYLKR